MSEAGSFLNRLTIVRAPSRGEHDRENRSVALTLLAGFAFLALTERSATTVRPQSYQHL